MPVTNKTFYSSTKTISTEFNFIMFSYRLSVKTGQSVAKKVQIGRTPLLIASQNNSMVPTWITTQTLCSF